MGNYFIKQEDMRADIKKEFGDINSYLFVQNYNREKKSLLGMIYAGGLYALENARKFLIYFTKEGIYGKEISNSIFGDYELISWDEVTSFEIVDKGRNKLILITFNGIDKGFKVLLTNKHFDDNVKNFKRLVENNFYR